MKVGLLVWADGTADSDFLGTVRLAGVSLYDASHQPVSSFSLSATSGTDYLASPVPESSTWALWLLGASGMAGLGLRRRPARSRRVC